jgi:hypothetical protein
LCSFVCLFNLQIQCLTRHRVYVRMTNFHVTWSVHVPEVIAEGSSLCHRTHLRAELLVRCPRPVHWWFLPTLSPLPCATVCELLRSKWACIGSRRSWHCPCNPPSHSALSNRFTDMAPTASAGGSGSHDPLPPPPPPPPAKRVQVPAACVHCRRKKTKV